MKHFKLIALVGLVTVFCISGIAFAQGGQGLGCQQRFDEMDANHDGKLAKDEFMASPHYRVDAEQRFKTMDVNGRGYLTKDEFCSGKGKGMGRGMGQGQGQGKNQ
jgi:hypothetical protein